MLIVQHCCRAFGAKLLNNFVMWALLQSYSATHGIHLMHTGLLTSMGLTADGESSPDTESRMYVSMQLLSRHATIIKFPLGVMAKLRGCSPVSWYPTFSRMPSAFMPNMAIPSHSRRTLA